MPPVVDGMCVDSHQCKWRFAHQVPPVDRSGFVAGVAAVSLSSGPIRTGKPPSGGSGIRTHGAHHPTVFKTVAFVRSAIPPHVNYCVFDLSILHSLVATSAIC